MERSADQLRQLVRRCHETCIAAHPALWKWLTEQQLARLRTSVAHRLTSD